METRIGEVKGYSIYYDTRDKLFRLKDGEGNEVGKGKTQDEVEKQADKLAKMAFTFPILALIEEGLSLKPGKVTSVNIEGRSCMFIYTEKEGYYSKTKVHLRYSRVHERTPNNEATYLEIKAKRDEIKQAEEEITALIAKLEKPIDLDYFSLKRERY